jgi:hypothetical protein
MEESNINLDKISKKYKIEKKNVKFRMLIMKKAKTPFAQKGLWQMVELIHLNTMVTTYNHHFIVYSQGKK